MSTDDTDNKPLDSARRKFLKAAVYVPPAIVTTLMVKSAHAEDSPSCAPNSPCDPALCPPAMQ